jgi:hypothetical protein
MVVTKNCAECGAEFEAYRATQLCCSDKCRYRRKNKLSRTRAS